MKKVLVIEDDAVILENILDLIAEEGFEGTGFRHGEAAVVAAIAEPPDLVICDIGMPGMDGFDVLKALRSHDATTEVPFIFLSGKVERPVINAAMNLGADVFCAKPFTRIELLALIRGQLLS
jgi:DNA-binding response OmpR family regulator